MDAQWHNKITGANSRPASQFERRGLRQRVLVVERHARYHGGAAVAQFLSMAIVNPSPPTGSASTSGAATAVRKGKPLQLLLAKAPAPAGSRRPGLVLIRPPRHPLRWPPPNPWGITIYPAFPESPRRSRWPQASRARDVKKPGRRHAAAFSAGGGSPRYWSTCTFSSVTRPDWNI